MAKLVMEEQQEYSILPKDSIVLLKIKNIEVVDVPARPGGRAWQKLSFEFKVLDLQATGDGSPREAYDDVVGGPMWGSVPFKLTTSPENRLRQWLEAIYGQELQVGFELDTDLLLERTVRGVTSQYQTSKGYDRHQVQDLLPYAQTAVGAAPVAQAQPQNDPWATPAPSSFGGFSDEPPF